MELKPPHRDAHAHAHREADLHYARALQVGTALSLAWIVLATVAYLGGFLPPYVPLRDLPALWDLPLRDYLAAAKAPAGWGWLALAGRGDYLNFVGFALLAFVTTAAYARLLHHYGRRDRVYAILAAAQIAVMLAAASGLLNPR